MPELDGFTDEDRAFRSSVSKRTGDYREGVYLTRIALTDNPDASECLWEVVGADLKHQNGSASGPDAKHQALQAARRMAFHIASKAGHPTADVWEKAREEGVNFFETRTDMGWLVERTAHVGLTVHRNIHREWHWSVHTLLGEAVSRGGGEDYDDDRKAEVFHDARHAASFYAEQAGDAVPELWLNSSPDADSAALPSPEDPETWEGRRP